ncbi:GDSL esterase/lipase, partial [Striga asiatica]
PAIADLSLSLSPPRVAFMESPARTFSVLIAILLLSPIAALEYPQESVNKLYPHLMSNANGISPAPNPQPRAPALFVIGDSSVDCGTNNFLGTFARADRPPYGRDFDTGQPTGRFCNGRIPVDFIALELGLPFVPSYLGQSGSVNDMIRGVNYASAGAGIIFSSGSELGQHISLSQQMQQVMDTFQLFILSMGEDAAYGLISNSIFYISIGSNDFIHYYLRNASNVQSLYLPWRFNQFLAQTMKLEIQNLYNANVRNVVVMGLAPLGCAPYYLWLYQSKTGQCIETINDMILEFNFAMRFMVEELNRKLLDANIIFCDALEGSMDIIKNHNRYGEKSCSSILRSINTSLSCAFIIRLAPGFNVTTDACCGLGMYRGWIMCISPDMACNNASSHIWWDQFHPTHAVNEILADNVWSSRHTSMCYPMNLQELIAQNAKNNSREKRIELDNLSYHVYTVFMSCSLLELNEV